MLTKYFFIIIVLNLWSLTNDDLIINEKNKSIDIEKINGPEISVSYDLKNIGDKSITIKRVSPHCGCTEFELSKWIIQPDETALLILKTEKESLKKLKKLYAVIEADTEIRYYKVQFSILKDADL